MNPNNVHNLKLKGQDIGKRLRSRRREKGLSQERLAEIVGSSQAVIQKIENGHSQRPRIIEEIAVALDVSPAWLAWGYPTLSTAATDIALRFDSLTRDAQADIKRRIKGAARAAA